MADERENELRNLRERLVVLETANRSDRRWLIVVGIILLGVLGYTSFIALPQEVRSQLPGAVTKEVEREAPQRVKEEIATWLKKNNGEALLEKIRKTEVEVAEIEARAAADANSIQAKLEAQESSGIQERVSNLEYGIENLKPASCYWLCGTDWCNGYKSGFTATCKEGEFLAGFKSTFASQHSDRGFNIYCCKVRVE